MGDAARRLGLGSFVAWLIIFLGCASLPAPSVLRLDHAVAQTLTLLHYRLTGHASLPDHEWAMCLRGRVEGDTVFVTDFAAPYIRDYNEDSVDFGCTAYADAVGIWHNHLPRPFDTCMLSAIDSAGFAASPWRVSIVTCGMPPRFVWEAKE